ncbi:LON peptidase substrate-binding domain-containing protein, partial [Patescibacteria group bacterium]|nr:LON peptidase substrate-binding domain-containing protein [Patescibacteria group bacterium]
MNEIKIEKSEKMVESKVKVLPLIPLRNLVLFPSVEASLFVGRPISKAAISTACDRSDRLVLICAQVNEKTEKPEMKDLYSVGVIARVEHILQTDNNLHVVVTGLSRVNIRKLVQKEPFLLAEFTHLPVFTESTVEIQKEAEALLGQLKKAFSLGRQFDLPAMMRLSTGISSGDLADQVCFSVAGKVAEKQKLLETLKVGERLKLATEMLIKEMKVAELEKEIEKKTQDKFNKGMKRNVLEERKKQIDKELKRLGKRKRGDVDELEKRIRKSKIPKDIKKKILKEHKRLSEMSSMAPESSYIRTYLGIVVDLPWGKYGKSNVDIKKSKSILNKEHYGLKDVKERILEYLAVMKLKEKNGYKASEKQKMTNILCFIGPPGVGKTSIGKSIAGALGRKFVRSSVGGIRDEAEIRG